MHARFLVLILTLGGCARDPLEAPCPNVAVGGLALSEIRGKQTSSTDGLGQWIELYNTTSAPVALTGLAVEMTSLTGSSTERIEVRSTTAQVAAHSYFVLGRFPAASKPAYVDYAYGDDFTGDIMSGGGMELISCGTVIDHVTYRSLPNAGTYSYDGNKTPDATGNDSESSWCTDAAGTGFPGTPQKGNNKCTQ